MAALVRIKHLTDLHRHPPLHGWARGSESLVTATEARLLIEVGHAELVPGEVMPPREAETATRDAPETPERATLARARRGDPAA